MDLTDHFRQLLHYDSWANREVIRSIFQTGAAPAGAVRLLAHVVSAEHLWLARLTGREQTFPVWPDFTLEQCAAQADEVAELWRQYYEQLPGILERRVTYRNSKGEAWTNQVRDILTHVFFHSAYHRGQMATNMRETGHVPAYTDFIHAVRQGLVE